MPFVSLKLAAVLQLDCIKPAAHILLGSPALMRLDASVGRCRGGRPALGGGPARRGPQGSEAGQGHCAPHVQQPLVVSFAPEIADSFQLSQQLRATHAGVVD